MLTRCHYCSLLGLGLADVGIEQPLVGGLVCGVANLAGTILGIYLVDRRGRRSLLLLGAVGMSAGMLTSSAILVMVDVKAYPIAGVRCYGPSDADH